jgi:hypothetical protein
VATRATPVSWYPQHCLDNPTHRLIDKVTDGERRAVGRLFGKPIATTGIVRSAPLAPGLLFGNITTLVVS